MYVRTYLPDDAPIIWSITVTDSLTEVRDLVNKSVDLQKVIEKQSEIIASGVADMNKLEQKFWRALDSIDNLTAELTESKEKHNRCLKGSEGIILLLYHKIFTLQYLFTFF